MKNSKSNKYFNSCSLVIVETNRTYNVVKNRFGDSGDSFDRDKAIEFMRSFEGENAILIEDNMFLPIVMVKNCSFEIINEIREAFPKVKLIDFNDISTWDKQVSNQIESKTLDEQYKVINDILKDKNLEANEVSALSGSIGTLCNTELSWGMCLALIYIKEKVYPELSNDIIYEFFNEIPKEIGGLCEYMYKQFISKEDLSDRFKV